jgi:hypothetical protein
MEADVSLSERRAWLESTPAGALHRALGISDAVDHDAADAMVDEVRKHHARTYGRELDEGELRGVRVAAERRSVVEAVRDAPTRVPELVDRVNSATVNAGWSYVPEFRGSSSGIAIRQGDGTYQGDPVVAAAAKSAEEAKRLAAEADMTAWRTGPAVMRTIARPS